MWWRWVFQFQFPHTCTTRIIRKIIFHKVSERLKRIIRTFTGFIAQDAQWEMRALFDVILEVCGIVRLYFPYKCSTKSSFMWFGKQWIYLFKIWTSLTEGCFQFQMLTRAVFVSTARACGCTWLCESSLMYLQQIQIKLGWALFVTYTIIQSIINIIIMRSEMCSLHLTHPSVHTWSSGQLTVQRPGSSRGLPVGAGIRTHNLGLPRVSSPTLYPLGQRLASQNGFMKINVNSQLRLKGLNGQDKPHYFLYFKRETCVNAV